MARRIRRLPRAMRAIGGVTFVLALASDPFGVGAYAQSGSVFAPDTRKSELLAETGWAALGVGQFERARTAFREALSANEQNLAARAGLARSLAGEGRIDAALEHSARLSNVSPRFRLQHVAILVAAGRAEDALSELGEIERSEEALSNSSRRLMAFLRGEAVYLMGGYGEAVTAFQRANTLREGSDAWRGIGDALAALERPSDAIDAYTRAIELRRHDGAAWRRRGRLRFLEGDVAGALNDFDEAQISLEPTPEFLSMHGEALLKAGAYADAVTVFRRLLRDIGDEDTPRSRSVRYQLASALIEAGRISEAQAEVQRISEWQEQRPAVLVLLGRLYFAQGDHDTAIRYYTAGLELIPSDPDLLYNRSLARLKQGQTEQALSDLYEGRYKDPTNPMIRDAIGRIRLMQGRYEEGIEFYNAAVSSLPNDAAPRTQRGRAFLSIGAYDRALDDARAALAIEPGSLDASYVAARALLAKGGIEAAQDHAQHLIRSRTHKREGFLIIAEGSISQGQTDNALSAIAQARNHGAPESRLALLEGEAQSKAGDDHAAYNALSRAVELNPGSTKAHRLRAASAERLGALDEAIAGYSEALRHSPGSAELHLLRAEALRKQGRCEEALPDFNAVLANDPNNSAAQAARGSCHMATGAWYAGIRDRIGAWF